ncbi:MAG: DinB family protein, partial [Dehalococcoidia bacterium]|nr:DinB family protein [Dehalococcoidia bacterium]
EWNIAEVGHHVLASSANVASAIEAIANGNEPPTRAMDPPREAATLSIAELRERLTKDALAWCALTERLPTSPNLDVTAPHPIFGQLHAGGLYLFQRVHDLDHVGQIAKNKNAPGYPQD